MYLLIYPYDFRRRSSVPLLLGVVMAFGKKNLGKKKGTATQKSLADGRFYPFLKSTAVAIGKFISVPGNFWDGCPAADKEKKFKCIVVEFVAVHDFSGFKGSGFKVRVAAARLCAAFAACSDATAATIAAVAAAAPPYTRYRPQACNA